MGEGKASARTRHGLTLVIGYAGLAASAGPLVAALVRLVDVFEHLFFRSARDPSSNPGGASPASHLQPVGQHQPLLVVASIEQVVIALFQRSAMASSKYFIID